MSADPTRVDLAASFSPDPLVRRMRGRATHGNTPFDVTFVSQIDGNLWQGGCQEGLILPEFIQHVVSLYPWEQYAVRHDLKSALTFRMLDSEDQEFDGVLALAKWVVACVEDGPTLVHCQAGLNRSSLVAAAALWLTGDSPERAVQKIRGTRSPACLCNKAFERWVLEDLSRQAVMA